MLSASPCSIVLWSIQTKEGLMAYVDGFVLAAPKDVMSNMPSDGKRMIYGGFETFLEP
jgi:uncharacterized protein YbaA (DUF1428 family)